MDSLLNFLKSLLPYALVLVKLTELFSTGALFKKPVTDDGYSAGLAVYERDVFRAERLSEGYFNNYWFENVRVLTNRPRKDIESNWGYGGLLSLTYKFAKLDGRYLEKCEKVIDGLGYYRRVKDGRFNGYSVGRAWFKDKASGGVAYDDNMWVARDLTGLYELTGEQKYLNLAVEIADYLIEDAFVDLDPAIFRDYGFAVSEGVKLGGFYWDDRHDALHVCSNGPAVQLLAALYRLTGNAAYLDRAVKSYNFLQTLVKPEGVFFDLMVFAKDAENKITGIVRPDGPSYTYNSGSPVTGAVELYKATGEEKYLEKAKYWAKSADAYFARESGAGVKSYPAGNVWFNAVLLNGFLALAPYDPDNADAYIGNMQRSIDFAYDNHRFENKWPFDGAFIPDDWVNGWGEKNPMDSWVLDAGANAEIYATLAYYYNGKG